MNEVLNRLSELLPERVWWVGDDTAGVYVGGVPQKVSLIAALEAEGQP